MTRPGDMDGAWALFLAGNESKALRLAWSTAQDALTQADSAALESVAELADAIEARGSTSHAEEARRLSAYCRAAASGAAGEVESNAILSRLYRMVRPRRNCVHCAAPVVGSAKYCSNCGQPQ